MNRIKNHYLPVVKLKIRNLHYDFLDMVDWIKKKHDKPVPPRRLNFTWHGDFIKINEPVFNKMTDIGMLKPRDRVLEVGSGIGALAIHFTDYLSNGEYWGIEIVKTGVCWCKNNISRKYPNFHFEHIDVYNGAYNKNGRYKANEIIFPFEDNYFDYVCLNSVFTHMLSSDIEHYLSEITRVLKPGGRCFITYFILNDESKELISQGKSEFNFVIPVNTVNMTVNKNTPEAAIAYEEEYLRDLYRRKGLKIVEPIHYGQWSGRSYYVDGQDIIIALKE